MERGDAAPHQKFIDAMLASPMHIIATMRSKTVYVETERANGKKAMEKQGAAPQQRDGLEYEFTAVLDLSVDGHFANASKDRTRLFRDPVVLGEDVGRKLLDWLNSGKSFTEQAKEGNSEPMSEAQNKALMAYLSQRHGKDRAGYIAELSNFFGRQVNSSRELTKAEVSEFLEAVNNGREAA